MSDVVYGRSTKENACYQTRARLRGASLLDDLLVSTSCVASLEDVVHLDRTPLPTRLTVEQAYRKPVC